MVSALPCALRSMYLDDNKKHRAVIHNLVKQQRQGVCPKIWSDYHLTIVAYVQLYTYTDACKKLPCFSTKCHFDSVHYAELII